MRSYLVERYLPGVLEAEVRMKLERAQALCAELTELGDEVRYLGSIFLSADETCFCRFDAERAAVVAEVNQKAEFAFARISEGVAVSPCTA